MKKFLAIYTANATASENSVWATMNEKQRKQMQETGIRAWTQWATDNAGAIVEQGNPLGRTKSVSSRGIEDIRNSMTAYTVVQAESHEAAAKLFENHPHFTIFPGDAVEIMECLPIPSL